ncbi:MAG: hypothetical protein JWR35_1443 [Marmoricola sp.]|nr:hypothetical protein [Marmoricola sp.]
MFNQAFFTALYLEEDGVRAELAEPFRSLVDVGDLLTKDATETSADEVSAAGCETPEWTTSPLARDLRKALATGPATYRTNKPARRLHHAGWNQINLVPPVGVEPTLNGV